MVLIRVGPSGLVAARELRKEGYRVVVLEKNHDVGGQWLYQANVEEEDHLGRKPFLKIVVVVGNSLSGQGISIVLVEVAKKVNMSFRSHYKAYQ
ncbi:hypothetical protein DEO72_LG6g1261 [Vigna unguiculata]|uniref:Flavin-containing monooxygenase n=1 Tax=Vigna unguiculata TaxID=3917 RepID=A0A4D6M5R3_VIGUN|nr:hypothetical protein DEO72_LG6g1261 [Vigna unguiculata]